MRSVVSSSEPLYIRRPRAVTPACVVMLLLAAGAWAQTAGGTISGTVAGPRGALEDATIRMRNLQSGEVLETHSAPDGTYTLTVPAGSYDFFASFIDHLNYIQRDVEVTTDAKLQIDAALPEGPNIGIPGENAFAHLKQDSVIPTGPVPHTAEGKPDLSGVWFPSAAVDPETPPYRPWARALAQQRMADFAKDDPRSHCLPSGVARTMWLDLTKLVQTPDLLVILIEGGSVGYRQVFLDGRGHPPDFQPSWMGHSIGSWDGDTLVVDTVGFNDKGWIETQGQPQTEELHIIERFHRTDLGHLEVEITIDDPGAYERPWKIRRNLELAEGYELLEYVCNENEKPEHLVGAGGAQ